MTLDLPNAVKKQKGAPKVWSITTHHLPPTTHHPLPAVHHPPSKYTPQDLPDKVRILSDVKGEILPGQMVAIMGASGAGKTSLLNW